MTGRVTAARLLREAQALLQEAGAYGAVDVLGPLRLRAELRAPAEPEPSLDDDRDHAALAALELEAVPA